jgi:hypothetical protein
LSDDSVDAQLRFFSTLPAIVAALANRSASAERWGSAIRNDYICDWFGKPAFLPFVSIPRCTLTPKRRQLQDIAALIKTFAK